jgi:hypothetical protein
MAGSEVGSLSNTVAVRYRAVKSLIMFSFRLMTAGAWRAQEILRA